MNDKEVKNDNNLVESSHKNPYIGKNAYQDCAGTGVLSTFVFMILIFCLMFFLSKYLG